MLHGNGCIFVLPHPLYNFPTCKQQHNWRSTSRKRQGCRGRIFRVIRVGGIRETIFGVLTAAFGAGTDRSGSLVIVSDPNTNICAYWLSILAYDHEKITQSKNRYHNIYIRSVGETSQQSFSYNTILENYTVQ